MLFVIQVEGNIGSGKSTFLNFIKKYKNNRNFEIKFIDEPISDWQNINGYNLLNIYYNDMIRNAELFQFFVFTTLLNKCLINNFTNDILKKKIGFYIYGKIFTH